MRPGWRGRRWLSCRRGRPIPGWRLVPGDLSVRIVRVPDVVEGLAQVGWERVFGDEGVLAGLDLDGAVVTGGPDEFPDRPAGPGLDPAADGQRREHDGQVGLDGVRLAVMTGLACRSCLGMRKLFDLEEPAVGADHELRRDRAPAGAGRQIGDISHPTRLRAALRFSAQIRRLQPVNQQLTALQPERTPPDDKSRVAKYQGQRS